MATLTNLKKDLRKFERPERVVRFFKTGKGEYAEGDFFLHLKTDETRSIAEKYLDLSFPDLRELLSSKVHEERGVALMILSRRFDKVGSEGKKEIYEFYLENIGGVNNWDLVDGSSPNIIGRYLHELGLSKDFLYDLAKSDNLWKRRIAIMSTFYFIKNNDYKDALKISEILISDKHDLIQKAVGWMLREIGNRDLLEEEKFLRKNYKKMPRTMLRYAIEKFPEGKRLRYLHSEI